MSDEQVTDGIEKGLKESAEGQFVGFSPTDALEELEDLKAREAEVLADPELMTGINQGIENARQGKTTTMDFSEYLNDVSMKWADLTVTVRLPVDPETGALPKFNEGGDPITGVPPFYSDLAALLGKAFGVDQVQIAEVGLKAK